MSPIEMARTECANYDQGQCIGAAIDNTSCHPLKECLLHFKQRCGYFERCVLPLADRPGHMDFKLARRVYEKNCGMRPLIETRCECGQIMERGKRFCEPCRQKHRLETLRRSSKKHWQSQQLQKPSD